MYDISSPSKTNRSAQIPHQNNSGSSGLARAESLKELGVAESFFIYFYIFKGIQVFTSFGLDTFAVKSILTWPVKRPESMVRKGWFLIILKHPRYFCHRIYCKALK